MPAVGAETLVPALRALGEPHRLALVQSLRERERCVRDLVDVLGLSQPLVSHHLGKLAEAGLVTARQSSGFTYYALDPVALAAARVAVDLLLDVDGLPAVALPGGNDSCCRPIPPTNVDINDHE